MREKEIINGIILGNEAILKSFYRKHFPYIRSYILRKGGTKEDVEDVFQDALLLVYIKLKSNEDLINTSLKAYFYGVCKNIWSSQVRKERKWVMADILADNFEDNQLTITEQITQKDRKSLFNNYFSSMQDTTKQLWNLFFEEKSTKEVSISTGYTEKYVRKKKHETKKKLINQISKDPIYQELLEI